MVAQLARTAVPGSQHNVLVTVDYGMDGVDYLNNVIINATELQPSIFNAVCTSITLYYCHIVLLLGELLSYIGPGLELPGGGLKPPPSSCLQTLIFE